MRRRKTAMWWTAVVALGLAAGAASAANPPPALTPRHPTGFSTIEQRYVYAPPDEGVIEQDMVLGLSGNNEVSLEEPSMCDGHAKGRITYSKSRNKVALDAEFHGLPYRMSFTRPRDVSTAYNQWPVSVKDGKWQIWFVLRVFNFKTRFYYDSHTFQLIGNEFDVASPPPDAIVTQIPTMQMLESPMFEGTPGGEAKVHFEWDYDHMLDDRGTGGVYLAFLPYNLLKPDETRPYYTQGGLPASEAMNWDMALDSIHSGYGVMIVTSLEPDPKPSYLLSRDNTMVGWGMMFPASTYDGAKVDQASGAYVLTPPCGPTHVNAEFPTAYYDFAQSTP